MASDALQGDDTRSNDANGESDPFSGATRCSIPRTKLGAVEVPAIVQNVDRAVKAFGRSTTLNHVMDPSLNSIPFYLNPESPFCKPLMSHNARAHNVVLKVTVPKRTGRKRKRGSKGPWRGDFDVPGENSEENGNVASTARQDDPNVFRRKLADNVGKYQVEAVGTVKHTHRFRGLADFYWNTSDRSDFAQRYAEQVLPGDGEYLKKHRKTDANSVAVDKMKQFQFAQGVDMGPQIDILPPPVFTHMNIPFNYSYAQNPYIHTTEDGRTVNTTAVKQVGYSIGVDDEIPMAPQHQPDMTDARTVEVIAELEAAFQERPIWTRRSLLNHLGGVLRNWNELKKYLAYVAYQFKGGPWRDTVVPYGLDPRNDTKYRIYQTMMFKLSRHSKDADLPDWYSLHGNLLEPDNDFHPDPATSHIFDGETFHLDGKVWQVCDITEPILKELLENAAVRPERHRDSGWYHGALWAKAKAIMKTQLVGIRLGRKISREEFEVTLQVRDTTPERTDGPTASVPLPNLYLPKVDGRPRSFRPRARNAGTNVRMPTKEADQEAPGESANLSQEEEIETEDSGSGSEDDLEGEHHDDTLGYDGVGPHGGSQGGHEYDYYDHDQDESAYPDPYDD